MIELRALDPNEYAQAQLLIQFMEVCSRGLVRPYDPAIYYQKLMSISKKDTRGYSKDDMPSDISSLLQCCPPSTEVRDVQDLKPYILASAERIAEILDIPVQDFRRYND